MKYSGVGNSSNHNNPSTLFCEQVSTVTSLFEKWNECERTVVMYALLKRLRYPTIKFLQCSIENNIINNQQINLITRQQYLKTDLNANDINYLQKLLSAYKIDDNNSNNNCNFNNYTNNIITPPLNDKDSILLYESDSSNSTSNSSTISSANKQIISSNNNIATIQSTAATHGNILINRNGKIYNKKEEILRDILTMLPLLKPGNDEIKNIYLSIIPLAVEDTVRQIVSTDLVQQIFSYLLIHPAISNEDRRSLSTWLKHLEDHIQSLYSGERSFYILTNNNSNTDTSLSKSSSMTSSLGGGFGSGSGVGIINNNNNSINKNTWQAIAPPSSQQQLNFQNRRFQQQQTTNSIFSGSSGDNGSSGSSTLSGGGSSITSTSIYSGSSSEWNMNLSQLTDNICDNFQRGNVKLPITKNLTTKSNQNNSCLGLIYDGVVNPVNNCSTSTGSGGGGGGSSSGSSSNLNLSLNHNDDHHVSFSKNGTEIIDFDDINQSCDKCNTQIVGYNSVMLCCCDHQQNLQQQKNNLLIGTASSSSSSTNTINNNYSPVTPTLSAAAALIAVPHQSELPRWNLDVGGKISSIIKTRRSNSLTTPAIISSSTTSSSSSSSTSSVITVNDNCSSNSSENLSQYAQKPRSYSLSIEHPRGALSSSGSDTRLDDMKQQPTNYMKFQTHNIGMSNIGQWLKSLRLHKYIGLFATITYENMLEITEEYLQSLGVTKGASHKLALCIDKLKDRYYHLIKLEQDLLSGQITLTAIIEELTNIVLTPMRPVDSSPNNVAYKFLQLLELVSSNVIQKEVNTIQDEDCVNALLWILERSIHAEAFMTHTNQLKEQKFKLSKLKAQFSPKIHPQHNKNGSNGSLNKPRWTKSRNKNDNTKSGSIDRINNRKNSHDIVSFSLNTLQQNNSNSAGGVGGNIASTIHNLSNNNLHDIEKYHHLHKNQSTTASNSLVGSSTKMSSTSSTSTTQQQQQHFKLNSNNISSSSSNNSNESSSNLSCPQYKSSSYPNFSNTCGGGGSNSCGQITNQQEQHQQQHQQQQQIQQHHQLQHQYNQQQYRHRHSLNNLIVVSSNPQQPQQMIFKQGKGGFSKIDSTIISSGGGDNISGGKNHRRSSITNSNCSGSAGVLQSNISTTVQQSSNLDNSNNVGNNSHLKPNKNTEKTFAEIISVSNNNNNNNNINNNGSNYNNSINNIKSSSLLNCENIINVIGGGDGSNSINCSSSNNGGDNNIIIDNNCCNSGLITTTTATTNSQSINNTTNSNLLNQNNSNDINNQKISKNNLNDINRSLEQLEFLCLQMTEQAIN